MQTIKKLIKKLITLKNFDLKLVKEVNLIKLQVTIPNHQKQLYIFRNKNHEVLLKRSSKKFFFTSNTF